MQLSESLLISFGHISQGSLGQQMIIVPLFGHTTAK